MADREAQAARVAVVGRVGCHLCEQAIEVVRKTLGVEAVTVLDVDGELGEHAARAAEWSELVPVILIDGLVHDVIRVNPARLVAALAGRPRRPGRLGSLRRG